MSNPTNQIQGSGAVVYLESTETAFQKPLPISNGESSITPAQSSSFDVFCQQCVELFTWIKNWVDSLLNPEATAYVKELKVMEEFLSGLNKQLCQKAVSNRVSVLFPKFCEDHATILESYPELKSIFAETKQQLEQATDALKQKEIFWTGIAQCLNEVQKHLESKSAGCSTEKREAIHAEHKETLFNVEWNQEFIVEEIVGGIISASCKDAFLSIYKKSNS